jgi:hypothetical protein
VDRPVVEFEPRPPKASQAYRPDTICDGWSTDAATVRLASVRGYAHRHSGLPRQDDVMVAAHPATGFVVFAVADGVSSAPHSHVGAQLACQGAVVQMLRQLDAGAGVEWQAVVREAASRLLEHTSRTLGTSRGDPRQTERMLATTLVAGAVRPSGNGGLTGQAVQIGDSGAWVLSQGTFRPVLGSKTDGGDGVVPTAVTPLPRVPDAVRPRDVVLAPGEVLLVGTDGFGDPLGDGGGLIGELFVRRLTGAVPPSPREFAHVLDFSRETFDDDRTLLAIWPRPAAPGRSR